MFTHLGGKLRCLACKCETDALIQTYLFKTTAENASATYKAGDGEIVDGLDNFSPLYPWDKTGPVVLAVGDWDCGQCGLNWQWAKLTIRMEGDKAVILGLSTLLPKEASDLAGVHYLQGDLADLGSENGRCVILPPQERCGRIAAGFRSWCKETAKVEF